MIAVEMLKRVALLAALGSLLALLVPVTATASQEIEGFEVLTSDTAAGGHPDLEARIALDNPGGPEAAEDLIVNLPQGLFGNPQAIPLCRSADFAQHSCPITSQAGTVTVRASFGGDPEYLLGTAPLFDMDSRSEEETARLAFIVPVLNIPISIPIAVRTGSDYGLRMTVTGITQEIPLATANVTVWGFPAAKANDNNRFAKGSPGSPANCPQQASAGCASQNGQIPHAANIAIAPLINNPSTCIGPLKATLDVKTYQDPHNLSHAEAPYPATTDCEKQTFNPVFNAALTSKETDAPSGLDMQLKAPQFASLAATPSYIRHATLVLPKGLSINPDAADGQSACTDAQANFGSDGPAACPDNAKIGNFDIRTPALPNGGPLNGSLYFGEPKPGNQYRVFMVADGFGIHAKLVASVRPDPNDGQLTIEAIDLPQVPFEQFNLHLFASQRGLVATPLYCTAYQADSVFAPWNSTLASQRSRPVLFVENGPNGRSCPGQVRPFSPRLVAGMSTPVAGAFSNFHLKLDRDDGDQFLGDLNFKMPPGFTGYLKGISYCPEAAISEAATKLGRTEQANASCPSSSQVGTTNVAAGPGSHPFNAVGKMYLAGPFKGAPISLAAVTPALAGPYDYGTQVVRVALNVDPLTAQVKAISDKVPSIIGGVPIRMRSIQVNIDRENFTINPTNCENFSVDSQGIGDQGTITDFSSPFHAVNCASLPFKPRMKVTQLDKKRAKTKRNANPRLRFELFTRPGDANIKSMLVTLPKAFQVDQRHLGNICSKAQLAAERCKGRQPIGTVWVKTPLLDQPLQGPAYAVSGYGILPRLAFILDGQVTLVPQAESKSDDKDRLATTVPVVPDAPIGHFKLDLLGGKQGYLINTRDLCKGKVGITVDYVAQSGKTLRQKVKPKGPCGAGASRKTKRAKRP